ncbi:MAG: serine O-acetyltransferase [Myxococcales bacterium]
MSLAPVVEALCSEAHALVNRRARPGLRHEFPSRATLIQTVEDLRSVLFPGYFGPSEVTGESVRYYIGATLDRVLHTMAEQIKRGLCAECEETDPSKCADCDKKAFGIAQSFIATLPHVRRMLATDVLAAYEGDPAATSPDEAIYSYPGMLAITNYRLAHELLKLGAPLIPRIITEHAHSITGIDIHPGATIDERFFIDHGTGVVIGETCLIGKNVRIYQGVTLGAKSFPLDEHGNPIKGIPRHPIVEDDVIIYSNATILGRVTIGKGSVIGGNVWLTRSVPPGSSITQAQLKDKSQGAPTAAGPAGEP